MPSSSVGQIRMGADSRRSQSSWGTSQRKASEHMDSSACPWARQIWIWVTAGPCFRSVSLEGPHLEFPRFLHLSVGVLTPNWEGLGQLNEMHCRIHLAEWLTSGGSQETDAASLMWNPVSWDIIYKVVVRPPIPTAAVWVSLYSFPASFSGSLLLLPYSTMSLPHLRASK